MNKARLEAFTDAIVAIVVTILILEFKAPSKPDIRLVLDEWQSFVVYIISFLLIFTVWYDHHDLFKIAKHVDKRAYWANAFWLFWLSVIPYATSFAGKFPNYRGASLLYLGILFMWTISYIILSKTLIRVNPEMASHLRQIGFLNGSGLIIFEGTLVSGFIISYFVPIFTWIALIVLTVWTIFFNRGYVKE
ncbi:TMEM175 family protein [Dellaglioa sp. L3N]